MTAGRYERKKCYLEKKDKNDIKGIIFFCKNIDVVFREVHINLTVIYERRANAETYNVIHRGRLEPKN